MDSPQTTEQNAASELTTDEYVVTDSLMARIAETAARNGISKHQLIGYLLTWALHQVDIGNIELPKKSS